MSFTPQCVSDSRSGGSRSRAHGLARLGKDPPGGGDGRSRCREPYNFRGIRQNTEGVSIWPYVDFGFTPFRGDGALKTVDVNVGTWNAFHSQINEDDFGTGNKWYEADIYGTSAWLRQGRARLHLHLLHKPGGPLRACEGAGGQGVVR